MSASSKIFAQKPCRYGESCNRWIRLPSGFIKCLCSFQHKKFDFEAWRKISAALGPKQNTNLDRNSVEIKTAVKFSERAISLTPNKNVKICREVKDSKHKNQNSKMPTYAELLKQGELIRKEELSKERELEIKAINIPERKRTLRKTKADTIQEIKEKKRLIEYCIEERKQIEEKKRKEEEKKLIEEHDKFLQRLSESIDFQNYYNNSPNAWRLWIFVADAVDKFYKPLCILIMDYCFELTSSSIFGALTNKAKKCKECPYNLFSLDWILQDNCCSCEQELEEDAIPLFRKVKKDEYDRYYHINKDEVEVNTAVLCGYCWEDVEFIIKYKKLDWRHIDFEDYGQSDDQPDENDNEDGKNHGEDKNDEENKNDDENDNGGEEDKNGDGKNKNDKDNKENFKGDDENIDDIRLTSSFTTFSSNVQKSSSGQKLSNDQKSSSGQEMSSYETSKKQETKSKKVDDITKLFCQVRITIKYSNYKWMSECANFIQNLSFMPDGQSSVKIHMKSFDCERCNAHKPVCGLCLDELEKYVNSQRNANDDYCLIDCKCSRLHLPNHNCGRCDKCYTFGICNSNPCKGNGYDYSIF